MYNTLTHISYLSKIPNTMSKPYTQVVTLLNIGRSVVAVQNNKTLAEIYLRSQALPPEDGLL